MSRDLAYWHCGDALGSSAFPPTRPLKFLTFEQDSAGLNNIRIAFEHVVVLAAITGRTLVLPPAQSWYLLHWGPVHVGKSSSTCGLTDVFNIEALQAAIPVVSADQFVRAQGANLKIPVPFQSIGDAIHPDDPKQTALFQQWKNWLRENHANFSWSPYEMLLCIPSIAAVKKGDMLADRYVDGRELKELTVKMEQADILHIPSGTTCRQLGQVAAMLASDDPALIRSTRRLLKNHVRYGSPIFDYAQKAIAALPAGGYVSLHIRRNDFHQFEGSLNEADSILENIHRLMEDDIAIYIATDETDDGFLEIFERDRPVYKWTDFFTARCGHIFSDADISTDIIGPIEQLICAAGTRFIGTDLSTFSSYINRLRGFLNAPDKCRYVHTEHYERPLPDDYVENYGQSGRNYLREFPDMWQDS